MFIKPICRERYSVALALLTLLCCIPMTGVSAAETATEGYYTYQVKDGKAMITDVDDYISGKVTIPSTLGGYPVTEIGNKAFYECQYMTGVTIPDSVVTIYGYPNGASYNCTKLSSVTFGKGLTTIYGDAFKKCSALRTLDIPDNVTSIGDSAFAYCTRLTDVYYGGSEKDWSYVLFNNSGNENLLNATFHYNYDFLYDIGDVNLDNTINVKDATAIQKHLASIITLGAQNLSVEDFNADNTVNVKDATAIQKFLVGII